MVLRMKIDCFIQNGLRIIQGNFYDITKIDVEDQESAIKKL